MARPLKVQRVDFSASDWLGGTGTLSLAERGLFITICSLIYVAGGPVTKPDVRRVCPGRNETFNSLLLRLVDAGKITISNGVIDQVRCEKELARARRRMLDHARGSGGEQQIGDKADSKPAQNESAPSPQVSSDDNELPAPYARGKGEAKNLPVKGFKGENDLGRCAPSEADKAHVDAVVGSLRINGTKVRDPPAYAAEIGDRKFHNLVRAVHTWVGSHLDGDARMAAWEVLFAAQNAGNREGLAPDLRRPFDALVKLYRGPVAQAAD